jgi:hypothetical protein
MGEWIKPNHAHSTVKIPGVDEAPYCRCEGCEGMRRRAGLIDGVALREKVEKDYGFWRMYETRADTFRWRITCEKRANTLEEVLYWIDEALGEGE